ncbi:MAG: tetratricopeptide repeat protein [Lentisphaeria bacterium]|nr:tetratricopeptide repeat protein [Lentisphaeria bacterium]
MHTAEGQYRFAEGLFFRKFYDLAENEFRSFLKVHPEHALGPDAAYRLILCLRNQGRKDDALTAMNDLQARWPEHELAVKLFLWKGELLHERRNYPAAEQCFRRLFEHEDSVTRETAVFFAAQCQEGQGKAQAALDTYRLIADLPFDDTHVYRPYALFALALAGQRLGQHEAAAAAFARLSAAPGVPEALRQESLYREAETFFAREDYGRAAELYQRCLGEFPGGAFARESQKRLAWAQCLQGEFARAAETAAAWRQKYGAVFDSDVDYIQAASLVGVEFYQEALPLLRRLVEDARVAAETVRLAAYQEIVCLSQLKRHEETAQRGEAFVGAFPQAAEVPAVTYAVGSALHALGNCEAAVPWLRRAQEGFLNRREYYEDAGGLLLDCLERLERFGEAAEVCRRLSEYKDISRAALYLLRAGEYERKAGRTDLAMRDFENVLGRFPQAAEESRAAMQHLGEMYSSAGDFGRAVGVVEKLLARAEAGADKARMLFFRGYLAYQQEAFEDAVTYLRAALAEPAGGAIAGTARFYLGGALLELERRDEALGVFGEVLALPDGERPSFPADLLFRLEMLYYSRNQYAVSERICRLLMARDEGEIVYRSTLRLADLLVAGNRLPEAEEQLAELRTKLREKRLRFRDAEAAPPEEEIVAILSEVYLQQDQVAKALVAAEQCLARKDLALEFVTRCRWVLAEALGRQNHRQQALPYAVKAYVLDDHPVYSPRAMLLALRLLVAGERMTEAKATLDELRTRYPVYAESVAGTAEVRQVIAAQGGAGPESGVTRPSPTPPGNQGE